MPLDSDDLKIITEIFANALRQSATQNAQEAAASISQRDATIRTATPLSISAYKASDATSVDDYFTRCVESNPGS
ncbi:hypothetical protein CVS40_10954 [Lucilia cuprina]|nr:hypothetical protein CVS40_10954 [Lucilia cuprina]